MIFKVVILRTTLQIYMSFTAENNHKLSKIGKPFVFMACVFLMYFMAVKITVNLHCQNMLKLLTLTVSASNILHMLDFTVIYWLTKNVITCKLRL